MGLAMGHRDIVAPVVRRSWVRHAAAYAAAAVEKWVAPSGVKVEDRSQPRTPPPPLVWPFVMGRRLNSKLLLSPVSACGGAQCSASKNISISS